jgi:serine/threonine-protein kinase
MAPEQALGNVSAIGPATDIYALGAVLYEMLTGRPPFVGQSAVETERKVIAEEPTPPSRFNGQVPRDLETICLKCLQKKPARRYASAQDLADDLHRFLDGKPVLARPVGQFERAVKWARRRPTLALLLAVLLVALATAVVSGLVLWQQASARQAEEKARRERARELLEAAIQRAYASARGERWDDAKRILEDAEVHVADADSDAWRQRLDEAQQAVQLDQTLDDIRQQAVQIAVEKDFVPKTFYPLLAAEFSKAFAQSPYDVDGPAEETAARIRASPLAAHTVAALDVWALAAFLVKREPLQEQLLRIARLADPDPSWGDRFRTPAAWHDPQALHQLADDALRMPKLPPAHQLSITGALLREFSGESKDVSLVFRGRLLRPGDFWSNWELASTLTTHHRHRDAVGYYRVASALRPGNVRAQSHVGASLMLAKELREGLTHYQTAVTLEPGQGMLRHGLVLAYYHAPAFDQAQAECQKGMDADPEDAWPPFSLGVILALKNRNEEAVPQLRKACGLNPGWALAHYYLGVALERSGRLEEALAAFQDADVLERYSGLVPRRMGHVLKGLGRHEEAIAQFEWVLREFDPRNRRRDWGPEDSSESNSTSARFGLAESLLSLGRFAEAQAAARAALKLPDLHKAHSQAMQRCLAIGEALAPWTAELPALCAGTRQPDDPRTQLLLAEWLYRDRGCPVAAVRCYEAAFAKPALAREALGRHRYFAACAAALAGAGRGADADKLTDPEKTALRTKARDWLKAEYDRLKDSKDDLAKVTQEWQTNADLAAVRDELSLARLPEAERKEWRALWAEVNPPAPKGPLALARDCVDRKQWARAADAYAQCLKDRRATDGEAWFEYAAVQLLSGDCAGYQQSCKVMLEAGRNTGMRGYLVARACTLASDPAVDFNLGGRLGALEMRANAKAFWSLTETGALCYRNKQFKEAVPWFDASLHADTRPGIAALNWLWLALTRHQLGEQEAARAWLNKAAVYLDGLGDERPATADAAGLHRHNWLEAHILRREVEALLSPK